MKQKFLTIISIFILLCIYGYLCIVFTPKNSIDAKGTNYYSGRGYLSEKGELDVIMFGNSDVYSGFSPCYLYEKYGYTSYASGASKQTMKGVNILCKEAIEQKKFTTVILDVDILFYKHGVSNVKYTSNILLAPFIFHYRWKKLKAYDFYTIPNLKKQYDYNKGFIFSNKIGEINHDYTTYMNETSHKEILNKKVQRQLNEFINRCRKKHIEIIFIELPSVTSWNYARHNYISDYANKNNIMFYDLNISNNDYSVDYLKDFRDNGNHLNINGAEKATEYIGKILEKHNIKKTTNYNKEMWLLSCTKYNEFKYE